MHKITVAIICIYFYFFKRYLLMDNRVWNRRPVWTNKNGGLKKLTGSPIIRFTLFWIESWFTQWFTTAEPQRTSVPWNIVTKKSKKENQAHVSH